MIKSVQKATKILSILSDSYNQPVRLCELAQKAQLNKSTCSHIVSTLENEGFATKISNSKGYILGPAAYCLSRFGKYKNDLISVCRPIMNYLYKNLGYSIILAVIEGDTKYIIDCIDDGSIFETKTRIRPDDIYRTATGRAILVNLPREKIIKIVDRYGLPPKEKWPDVSSVNDLFNYVSHVKKDSVFKTESYYETNNITTYGYGGAIFNISGCIGALGVALSVPENNTNVIPEDESKIIKLLERSILEINRRLKHKTIEF